MNKLIYLIPFILIFGSCNNLPQTQTASEAVVADTSTVNPVIEKKPFFDDDVKSDSTFKIGSYLFIANKFTKFEFVKKGNKALNKTKGDTIYIDNDTLLLGNLNEIQSDRIYKKFRFKSKFEDFKVNQIYKGKLAEPDFKTDPDAKYFITRIKESCKKEGINFAGHYTIVEWGCGCLCQLMAIVDRINGKILFSKIPFDTVDGHSGSDYRIDSRMLIVNTEALNEFDGYKRCNYWRIPAVLEMKNGVLNPIE